MIVIFTSPTSSDLRPQPAWDASSLSLMLGGDGRVGGEGWARAPCPAHGGTGYNLALRLTYGGTLIVRCWSAGCAPDAIRAAIDKVLGTSFSAPSADLGATLDPRPAYLSGPGEAKAAGEAAARSAAPAPDFTTAVRDPLPPARLLQTPATAPAAFPWPLGKPEQTPVPPAQRRRELREKLNRIWSATTPVTSESLVARYLTETRKITLPVIPRTLRFHPRLYHGPTGMFAPAMVALVLDHSGRAIAIHRTWLDPATLDKAFGADSRMMLGPCHGAAVHLGGDKYAGQLLVGEGIETTLAAGQLAAVGPGIAVWAALSTSGLRTLTVPRRFRHAVIAADHDANGAGAEAAEDLAHRLRRHGIPVDVRMPRTPGSDWNDALLAQRAGGEAHAEGGVA